MPAFKNRLARVDRKIALVAMAAVAFDAVRLQNRHYAMRKIKSRFGLGGASHGCPSMAISEKTTKCREWFANFMILQ